MSVTYIIEFDVRPAARERFLALLGDVLRRMSEEEAYEGARLHVDPQNGCRFLLHETWASHDDVVQVQLQRPYREAWHAALPDLLEAPRRISIWAPLPRYDMRQPMVLRSGGAG